MSLNERTPRRYEIQTSTWSEWIASCENCVVIAGNTNIVLKEIYYLWLKKSVSKEWISNYIHAVVREAIAYPCHRCVFLAQVLICGAIQVVEWIWLISWHMNDITNWFLRSWHENNINWLLKWHEYWWILRAGMKWFSEYHILIFLILAKLLYIINGYQWNLYDEAVWAFCKRCEQFKTVHMNDHQNVFIFLTHWGLVMPYGDRDLGQHWLR